MGLESIVSVNISRQTASVSQAGFGTGLMLSANAAGLFGGDTVRSYSSAADVSTAFGANSDEYKAASRYFGQSVKPAVLKIAKAPAKVAQVDTIAPVSVDNHAYKVSLSGRKSGVSYALDYTHTSGVGEAVSAIVSALITLINAGTATHGVVASGTSTLILTSNTAGQPFSTSINADANMTLVHTTANVGVADALSAIVLVDNDWYALLSGFRSIDDVMNQAEWIEATLKVFGSSSSAAGMYDGASTTDIAYLLKASNYFRSFAFFSGDSANFPEAAILGRCLPLVPGTETWAFKQLSSVVVDSLTETQISALKAKNCNYFIPVGGVNITLDGKVAGGEYIDVIRLIDLLAARMKEGIYGQVVRLDKIPFTNGGISIVQNECLKVLKANQKLGGIAPDSVDSNGDVVPGFVTSFPNVNDVSANDKAARTLSGGTWSAKIAGAIHAITINGTVTV